MSRPDEETTVVAVDGLHVAYGDRPALQGLSLSIRAGEIYGLLGPNGAGKTTLVRAISGRIRPDSGTVRVRGADPATSRSARAGIGLVPQQIALYGNLTCRENLRAFGHLLGVPRGRMSGRLDAVMAAIGLADRAADLCSRLSGGMQRRLNIGAAILHEPGLLVLDEPTVGVDLHAKEDIHDLLAGLRRSGMAILLTTHDMDQAATIADRVGIIAAGRLIAEGTPSGLVEDAFGDGREIQVAFAATPAPAVRRELAALDLTPLRGGAVWTGRIDGAYETAQAVEDRVRRAGGDPREISIRQPSLTSVLLRATGEDLAP